MTVKRAIQLIERKIHLFNFSCAEIDENIACEMAIKALKKQIPQKLDYEGDGYDDNGELIYDTAYCRECRHMFEVDYDEHSNYCPNCGQALDWGDTE